MLQMFNAVPMTFASIYIYSRFGVSIGLRLIVTVFLVGTILRASCYFYESFWLVAIGQVLCSCSNAFYANSVTFVVNKWFSDKERALATALLLIGGPIGVGISHTMTGSWFLNVDDDTERTEFLSIFSNLMITQLIITVIFWIVFVVTIKEEPDKPPSAVAEV